MLKKLLILILLLPLGLALASCGDNENGNGNGSGSEVIPPLNVEANEFRPGLYLVSEMGLQFRIINDDEMNLVNAWNTPDYVVIPTRVNNLKVTKIGNEAFIHDHSGRNNSIEVDFSRAFYLEVIGNDAFRDRDITELDFSNNIYLRSIGENAFRNNNVSGDLIFENNANLTSIGSNAFMSNEIEQVKIKNLESFTTIGEGAFNTNRITRIELRNLENLEFIERRAFAEQGGGINSIGDILFENLPKLDNFESDVFASRIHFHAVRTVQIISNNDWHTDLTWFINITGSGHNFGTGFSGTATISIYLNENQIYRSV